MTTKETKPTQVLARACSWCQSFLSPEDAERAKQGAMLTHTICPTCVIAFFPDEAEAIGNASH